MTVRHLWLHALGGFSGKPHQSLSLLRGKKVAFDGGILLNKVNSRELTKLTSTNKPIYASREILDFVQEFHNLALDAGIIPLYIWKAPPIKNREKLRRQGDRDKGGEEYDKFLCQLMPSFILDEDEVERAIASRKKKAHPSACDHAAVISWMASKDIWMFSSLFEGDKRQTNKWGSLRWMVLLMRWCLPHEWHCSIDGQVSQWREGPLLFRRRKCNNWFKCHATNIWSPWLRKSPASSAAPKLCMILWLQSRSVCSLCN